MTSFNSPQSSLGNQQDAGAEDEDRADHVEDCGTDSKKLWKNRSVCLAILGLENQTEEDPDVPIRVIAYDSRAYECDYKFRPIFNTAKTDQRARR